MQALEFTDGRAVVDLGDGRSLSILSSERTAYIDANLDPLTKMMGGLMGVSSDARAGNDTYEVAIMDTETERSVMDVHPAFEQYLDQEISSSSWTIYSLVPLAAIEKFVDGVKA